MTHANSDVSVYLDLARVVCCHRFIESRVSQHQSGPVHVTNWVVGQTTSV